MLHCYAPTETKGTPLPDDTSAVEIGLATGHDSGRVSDDHDADEEAQYGNSFQGSDVPTGAAGLTATIDYRSARVRCVIPPASLEFPSNCA